MSDRIQDRMDLYKRGLNDAEIARIQGVDPSAICHWRRANGLKRHAGSGRGKLAVSVGRRFLYDLKWSDQSIARQQQVTPQSVRGWRQHHGLSPNRPAGRNQRRAKHEQLHELQRLVVRAIGTRLPFDIAADAAADLMLAVVEGRVPLNQIEKHGRAFGNRALNQYANGFRQSSLEEELPNTEGMRKVDMLPDLSSAVWLEEMGATCH